MPKITNRPPNFVVPRMALMAWVFAEDKKCKATTRPEYRTIRFEKTVEGPRKAQSTIIHSVATNSHHLIHVWWEAKPGDILDDGIEIEAEAVDLFLTELSKGGCPIFGRGKGYRYRLCTEKNSYALVAEHTVTGAQEAWVEAGDINHGRGSYPNWRVVVPKWAEGNGPHPICFAVNFSYVLDFYRLLEEFKFGTGMMISYEKIKEYGQMLIRPEAQDVETDKEADVEYVLMPKKL
jgi:hypothetical protein